MAPRMVLVRFLLPLTLVTASLIGQTTENSDIWRTCPEQPDDGTIWHGYERVLGETLETRADRKQYDADGAFFTCETGHSEKPVVEREPQSWQWVDQTQVLVFSAFYEQREAANGPSVRVIANGWQAAYNDIGALYCQMWFDGRPDAVWTEAQYIRIYPSTMHPDMYVSHFIICRLPVLHHHTPYALHIRPQPCSSASPPPDGGSHHALLVLNRTPIKHRRQHALCISPIYGHFRDWGFAMEIFELHKLIGAEEITTYNQFLEQSTKKMLDTYTRRGRFNLIRWKFPRLKSNVFCQRGALNDCLYRMGHKYEFVSVNDMDEILVPRMTDTWQELMAVIKRPSIGAYLFQHSYFRRNESLRISDEPYLVTQTAFYTTDVVTPPGKIRCKPMFSSELAVSIDLHYAYQMVPGAEEYILPPSEGMLHHYRHSPMETFVKQPDKFTFVEDKFMEKYKESLEKAVLKMMKLSGL